MKIYKFGGASVKDANGVRNILSIINKTSEKLIVVVSAMGKMTNALEVVLDAYFNDNSQMVENKLNEIKKYHLEIINELFGNEHGSTNFNEQFRAFEGKLQKKPSMHYDFEYDRIVSSGELLSTAIIYDFFIKEKKNCKLTDIRTLLKTDDLFRDANVNWNLTAELMKKTFTFQNTDIYLTQGFLGGTLNNLTTTLGREGSDYTAAIIGFAMDAENVTIWKDVQGVLNADPRWYPNAQKIDQLSYPQAIELTYYGAQIIHPKTLKPLNEKKIPLFVKSFLNPELQGTAILSSKNQNIDIPIFVLKENQVFVTLTPKDFSFIMEDKLIDIINFFKQFRIKMNLVQNSALNFSACFDKNRHTQKLFEILNADFFVRYNDDVQLVTIRHYNPSAIEEMTKGKTIINSQITRKMAMFVLK